MTETEWNTKKTAFRIGISPGMRGPTPLLSHNLAQYLTNNNYSNLHPPWVGS